MTVAHDLPAQYGYEECPHPGCRRPWHGLPAAYVNPSWPFCPGSWVYDQETANVQST